MILMAYEKLFIMEKRSTIYTNFPYDEKISINQDLRLYYHAFRLNLYYLKNNKANIKKMFCWS